jgi:hypothetical protein
LAEYDVVKFSAWLPAASPIPSQYLLGGSPVAAAAPTGPAGEPTTTPSSEPAAEPRPPKEPKPVKEPKPAAPAKAHSGTGFLIAGGAAAVVAGGLFTTSILTNGSFDENPTKLGYTLNHAGYWGSIGTGALALGLLTVGIAGSF